MDLARISQGSRKESHMQAHNGSRLNIQSCMLARTLKIRCTMDLARDLARNLVRKPTCMVRNATIDLARNLARNPAGSGLNVFHKGSRACAKNLTCRCAMDIAKDLASKGLAYIYICMYVNFHSELGSYLQCTIT